MSDHDINTDAVDEDPGPTIVRWREYETPSIAILSAVADVTGRDELDLPILVESVDPDALHAIVEHGSTKRDGQVTVSFRYCDVTVTIDDDGRLEVAP